MKMASNKFLSLVIMLLIICSPLVASVNGRKLLTSESHRRDNKNVPSSPPAAGSSLYMAALPKGTVPRSTPSKKGHADTTDQKLIVRHLAAIDRALRAVPSPGAGH